MPSHASGVSTVMRLSPLAAAKRGRLEAAVHDLALGLQRVGRQETGDRPSLPRATVVDERGIHDPHALGIDLRRAHRVGDVGHDLEGHPEAGIARQLEAQPTQVQDVLDAPGKRTGIWKS
jgi:hypothetical protein